MKFLFSDVDGTLVHKTCGQKHIIQVPGENRYISRYAINSLEEIRRKLPVAIITGRRLSGYERLSAAIPHDYAIIEHGCVILDRGKPDIEWASRLKEAVGIFGCYNGLLWDYAKSLEREGYKTDYDGRLASVRVFLDKPDNLNEEEKLGLETRVVKEAGHLLRTTRNQEMLDIIPKAGGKINASNFILSRRVLEINDAIALGDDVNDEDLLLEAGFPMCPGNAVCSIKDIVKKRNGYVSVSNDHEGTIDMLNEVFKHV
ncbi:HAD family phosphatase [Candidatus Woesearchaeota archaeon]|nr:HAD family phosphatase [Candidatus Woesearchaeota archaeon]